MKIQKLRIKHLFQLHALSVLLIGMFQFSPSGDWALTYVAWSLGFWIIGGIIYYALGSPGWD
jgi:hypothetical protein